MSANGYVVFLRMDTLFAQAFDLTAVRAIGPPVVVAEQIAHDTLGVTALSIADGRALVYRAATPAIRELVWVDRAGKRLVVVGEPGTYGSFTLSRDERQVIAERAEPGGNGLWLIDVVRGVSTKVVPAPLTAAEPVSNRVFAPVFSADGQRFVCQTRRNGRAVILEQPSRGGVDACRRMAGGWRIPGRTGRAEVYVSPVPPTGEKWRVSTAGGRWPEWRRDGLELFYLSPGGSLMATPVRGGQTFEAGIPTALFAATGLQPDISARGYAASGDGQHFLLNALREGDKAATTSTLQIRLNWTAGLHK